MAKKIAVVTGSRADFGLLRSVCDHLEQDIHMSLSLLVTGSHLSKHHGRTKSEIDGAAYKNVIEIDLKIDGDAGNDINTYISRSIRLFGTHLQECDIDCLVVLGDRYEIFGAAIAAAILNIPIAHIHGGEVTAGAFDEFIRHSITKMSSIHFTSTEIYRKRVIQLGEDPSTVFYVGGLGAENIEKFKLEHGKLLTRHTLERQLDFKLKDKIFVVTYHPVTLALAGMAHELKSLLNVLQNHYSTSMLFSMPNADTGNHEVFEMINEFVLRDPANRKVFHSLGQLKYFSILNLATAIIGNSSSGLLEAPSFHVGTVNIGDRQRGRVYGESVVNVSSEKNDIARGIDLVCSSKFRNKLGTFNNPYYKKDTAQNIINRLANFKPSVKGKIFVDL